MTFATVIIHTKGENQHSVNLVYKQVRVLYDGFSCRIFNDNNNWNNLKENN